MMNDKVCPLCKQNMEKWTKHIIMECTEEEVIKQRNTMKERLEIKQNKNQDQQWNEIKIQLNRGQTESIGNTIWAWIKSREHKKK